MNVVVKALRIYSVKIDIHISGVTGESFRFTALLLFLLYVWYIVLYLSVSLEGGVSFGAFVVVRLWTGSAQPPFTCRMDKILKHKCIPLGVLHFLTEAEKRQKDRYLTQSSCGCIARWLMLSVWVLFFKMLALINPFDCSSPWVRNTMGYFVTAGILECNWVHWGS